MLDFFSSPKMLFLYVMILAFWAIIHFIKLDMYD